ncbi:pituitary adenylate cyclase-activating polypeptide type I receptor-like [Centropristis striata]|uniref:pituitary adenylate cyclase-activating polypeptide type I receptor-like n=1 Tax=Centropristis striata TaxID=184440 RepID=UPI0027E0980D|nr:pituitary adenylate cyclase-activating polypeptide type I receptor-like [Centropristis striata]
MKDIKKTDNTMEVYCKALPGRQETFILLIFYLHLWYQPIAEAIHPDCAIIAEHRRAQEVCSQTRRSEARNQSELSGCNTEWDDIGCWLRAEVGQVVNVSCSEVFQHFSSNQGYVYRNCTADGWSEMYPPYDEACAFSDDSEPESVTSYLSTFRQVYTVGYATSLISLITAIVVFTAFRKFRCTRNYIHINLFSSFVLRASAVFIKDTVLFADETLDHCSVSTAACKSAVAFFQFSILANYFWLLVEGMYLQTLLALTFVSQRKYFWWYILIGWGLPSLVLILWVLTRLFHDDRGCWDDTDKVAIWWIIKGPITASLLVNIVIFINVIRILVQKLKSSAMVGNNDTGHFMRLAKSTLFLIPLFGMHYTVFAFLPETTGVAARLYIELGLGSFQGFVVALLYCFMNGEVQTELRRWLRKCRTQNHLTPAKRSITQITVRASRGLGRPPSSGNISSV